MFGHRRGRSHAEKEPKTAHPTSCRQVSRKVDERPVRRWMAIVKAPPRQLGCLEETVFLVGQNPVLRARRMVAATETTTAQKARQRRLIEANYDDREVIEKTHDYSFSSRTAVP